MFGLAMISKSGQMNCLQALCKGIVLFMLVRLSLTSLLATAKLSWALVLNKGILKMHGKFIISRL